jgi:MFS family permease
MMMPIKSPCEESEARAAPGAVQTCRGPWVLIATILASSMAFIEGTVVNVALPALQTALHASVTDIQWVVESYALLLASLLLLGGSLGDLYGRRRIFLFGVLLFAIGSSWCGLASSITFLIVARGLQGIGAAFLIPGSLAIISASYPADERGRAIGTWSGFTAITIAIGPVLGGWLVEHASWRWVFFINLPLAVIVILLSLWRVQESRNEAASTRLDWQGRVRYVWPGRLRTLSSMARPRCQDAEQLSGAWAWPAWARCFLPYRRITLASSVGLLASLPVQKLFRGQSAHIPDLRAA